MSEARTIPNLEGLMRLALTNGIDIRPTLLRVVTDLFVQRGIRSTAAARNYIMLTQKLLDSAGADARKIVADKLAKDPLAPRQIIQRLARDEIAIAEPVLRHSPVLTAGDLEAIEAERGAAHGAIIAARKEIEATAVTEADEPAGEASAAAELNEAFFVAESAERRLILMTLDATSSVPSPELSPDHAKDAIRRLETAALAHNTQGFAHELTRTLGVSHAQARRIVDDPSGEPIVVVAKALRSPADVLHRILLFLNPQVGRSVQRVYGLALLHDEITVEAARHLVAIWREIGPAKRNEIMSVTRRRDPENGGLSDLRPRQSIRPDRIAIRGSGAPRSLIPARAAVSRRG